MSNGMFITVLTFALLFAMYFTLYGYFSNKKKGENAKGVSIVFLVQGIIFIVIYFVLVVIALVTPSTLGIKSPASEATKNTQTSNGIRGLEGGSFSGLEGAYEYPSDPEVAGMLSRGDGYLQQNNFQAAINEYKQGLKGENFKDVFEKRLENALNLKEDFKIYEKGLAYFNKGELANAKNEFKDIKPNDHPFYADILVKMESINSAGSENNTNDAGENNTTTPTENPTQDQATGGNTAPPTRP